MFKKIWKILGLEDIEEENEKGKDTSLPYLFNRLDDKKNIDKSRNVKNLEENYVYGTKKEKFQEYIAKLDIDLVVIQPEKFEDAQKAADCIKKNQQVIIDCSETSKDISRRILDFMSGAVYTIGGTGKKVSATTFIFVPENTDIKTSKEWE